MDDYLSLDECINSFKILKVPQNDSEKEVIELKNKWIEMFIPFLKYIIETEGNEDKIKANRLIDLWTFLVEGIRIRNFYKKFDNEKINELMNIKPIELDILDDDLVNILELGPFIYQVIYQLYMINLKLNSSMEKFKNIFSNSDNPIDWYKSNNKSELVNIKCSDKILNIWDKILKAENPQLDPILQK